MYCIHCGKPSPEGSAFCMHCGAKLSAEQTDAPIPEEAAPACSPEAAEAPLPAAPADPIPEQPRPTAKGSLKVPLMILAVLSVIGLTLFFLIPLGGSEPILPTEPAGEDIPWLTNSDGVLFFQEAEYDGGSELTVPETVDGDTVTVVSEFCFQNCDILTTVILPDTLERVGYQSFSGCDLLRGIRIPEGTLHIAGKAFANCPELEAISIPSTMETVEITAFDNCPSLKYVFFAGTIAQWNEIFDGCEMSDATVYCSDGECPLARND